MRPEAPRTIYTLSDPFTKQVRYVGITVMELKSRLSGHVNVLGGPRNNPAKCEWIEGLRSKGARPIIEALDVADNLIESHKLENYWTWQLKAWGFDLVNAQFGIQKHPSSKTKSSAQ